MYTLIVCGSRTFADKDLVFRTIDKGHKQIARIIEGGAKGADQFGADYANSYLLPHVQVKADWATHGKRAGYLRNQQMLDLARTFPEPVVVLAFKDKPVSKGTDMMCDIARKVGVTVHVYYSRTQE